MSNKMPKFIQTLNDEIYKKLEKIAKERAEEVLEVFPVLKGYLKRKAGTLSGGERQMLAMGMAMMYTGLMIGSGMVVEEKGRGTLRRILASPASPAAKTAAYRARKS